MKKNSNIKLDDYEKEIFEAYKSGKLKPTKTQTDFKTIAKNTLKKIKELTFEYRKMIWLHCKEKLLEKVFLIKL